MFYGQLKIQSIILNEKKRISFVSYSYFEECEWTKIFITGVEEVINYMTSHFKIFIKIQKFTYLFTKNRGLKMITFVSFVIIISRLGFFQILLEILLTNNLKGNKNQFWNCTRQEEISLMPAAVTKTSRCKKLW